MSFLHNLTGMFSGAEYLHSAYEAGHHAHGASSAGHAAQAASSGSHAATGAAGLGSRALGALGRAMPWLSVGAGAAELAEAAHSPHDVNAPSSAVGGALSIGSGVSALLGASFAPVLGVGAGAFGLGTWADRTFGFSDAISGTGSHREGRADHRGFDPARDQDPEMQQIQADGRRRQAQRQRDDQQSADMMALMSSGMTGELSPEVAARLGLPPLGPSDGWGPQAQ